MWSLKGFGNLFLCPAVASQCENLSRVFGTPQLFHSVPGDESPGYWRLSLRDKISRTTFPLDSPLPRAAGFRISRSATRFRSLHGELELIILNDWHTAAETVAGNDGQGIGSRWSAGVRGAGRPSTAGIGAHAATAATARR